MLEGALETIARNEPVIVLEDGRDNCAELMRSLGYTRCAQVGRDHLYLTSQDKRVCRSGMAGERAWRDADHHQQVHDGDERAVGRGADVHQRHRTPIPALLRIRPTTYLPPSREIALAAPLTERAVECSTWTTEADFRETPTRSPLDEPRAASAPGPEVVLVSLARKSRSAACGMVVTSRALLPGSVLVGAVFGREPQDPLGDDVADDFVGMPPSIELPLARR